MIRAIVFDFGNVVGFFDHFKTLARLAPYTTWTPRRIYDEIYAGPLEDDLESGRISVDEFLRRFAELCELNCDAEFLKQACGDIFTVNPAVCDLIPKLPCRLILGSNTNALHAAHFQAQFADVLERFHHQVLSHEIGVRKPKPEFFHECIRRAECAASECLFIDDLAANVAGAEAVGMQGLVYGKDTDLGRELKKRGLYRRA